jgi:hypothetical protein
MQTLITDNFHYTAKRFGIWRIAFGVYLLFYYLRLYPFAKELYTTEVGMPPAYMMSASSFFPEALLNFDSSPVVYTLLALCALCSVMIILGFKRRIAALVLWPLAAWLFNRNTMTDSPDLGFVNWLIFLLIFIPSGEAYALDKKIDKKDSSWKMPVIFYWAAWTVLGFGYFSAGMMKFQLHDPTWSNGTAMYYVLAKDNARFAWFGNLFDHFPRTVFYPFTWGGIYLEMGAPLFILFRKTRIWWWIPSTVIHILLLFFVNITEVSLGMILFHFFVFDEKWLGILPGVIRHDTSFPRVPDFRGQNSEERNT